MEKLTLLVNSCDVYSDVWELFFKALRVQWPDCKFPIVLSTETKKFDTSRHDVKVINLNSPCWGRRYKNALKEIHTPYLMPVLDDFVLKDKFTSEKIIEKIIKWLDENPGIGVFYLYKHPYASQNKTEFEGFGLLPQKSEYKLSTQAAIWRKSYLDKCIKGIENPWEWELFVTRHAWRLKDKTYALLEDQPEIFPYPSGGVIWRGQWHSVTKSLAERYDVKIDFSKRGFYDAKKAEEARKNFYHVSKRFPRDIFKKIFWRELRERIRAEIKKAILKI